MEKTFTAGEILGIGKVKLHEIISHLESIYCDSIGVEYMYIRKPEVIDWIQKKLGKNDNTPTFTSDEKKVILTKLDLYF